MNKISQNFICNATKIFYCLQAENKKEKYAIITGNIHFNGFLYTIDALSLKQEKVEDFSCAWWDNAATVPVSVALGNVNMLKPPKQRDII